MWMNQPWFIKLKSHCLCNKNLNLTEIRFFFKKKHVGSKVLPPWQENLQRESPSKQNTFKQARSQTDRKLTEVDGFVTFGTLWSHAEMLMLWVCAVKVICLGSSLFWLLFLTASVSSPCCCCSLVHSIYSSHSMVTH